MDFEFTDEQKALRDKVRDFTKSEVEPRVVGLERKGEFPGDIIKRMGELGLIGTITPTEYGGSMMGHVARTIIIEELSRVYGSLGFFLQTHHILPYLLLKYGSDDQKEKYLPPAATGEAITCLAVTEPTGGSDPSVMGTSASLDGDEYVINGKKVLISFGEVADVAAVLASTENGPSIFLVESDTRGFRIHGRANLSGLRSGPVNELDFVNCRIPKENLVGKEGKGLGAALSVIQDIGRTGVAGVALGVARGAYECALEYAKERELYGKPISKLQATQFKLADMDTKIEATKWLTYYCNWLLDQGKSGREIGKEVSRAKIFATEVASEVCTNAIHIHGAYGTVPAYHVVRCLQDSLELYAAAGTNDVMRAMIGGELAR